MDQMIMVTLESPCSLQDICVEYICNNFEIFLKLLSANNKPPSTSGKGIVKSEKNALQNENINLHAVLLEQLMFRLSKKQKLTDHAMALFDSGYIVFRFIKLHNTSAVTCKGFSKLKQLKIPKLEVTHMSIALNNLMDNLGKWTVDNLHYMNLSNSLKFSKSGVQSLLRCTSLQSLNVSYTQFDTQCLEMVMDGLPHLKALDISCTPVNDISSLLRCKDHLTSLSMVALEVKMDIVPVLNEMCELRELDCSTIVTRFPFGFSVTDYMPNLISLDISGNYVVHGSDLKHFLERHPKLCFLGCLLTTICSEDILINLDNPFYKPNLKVTGDATEGQILEALRHYKNHPAIALTCLNNLVNWKKKFSADIVLVDIFKAVLYIMENHSSISIQFGALDCLLKMTKGNLIEQIHPNTLVNAVNLVLATLKNNGNFDQIIRKSLQFLCKERILQDLSFDRYQCAHLVVQNLVTTSTQTVIRACVTILSYLVRKMTTNENSSIGAYPKFMYQLLWVLRSMLNTYKVDQTVKLTLCTLWSITDESPANCRVFVKEGGIKLFMKVLKEFEDDREIEESVLGIFSNVVEVPGLRPKLRIPDFVITLRKLLHSGHMDISYFAAMIISHLACDGIASWNVDIISRQQLLEEMEAVILSWKPPKEELVSYRTLHSFLPLLKCRDAYQVQLWAVWDLWHICSVNGSRYGPMLVSLGINEMILQLQIDTGLNNNVRRICSSILEILQKENV